MRNMLVKILAGAVAFGALASAANAAHHEKGESMAKNDIVATAVANGSFNTLAAALKAAGLVETLQGTGPFTVFAPTDAAFAKLPKGTVEELLKPENKQKLIAVLTYHVVPGKVMAKQAVTLDGAETVNGKSLTFKFDGETLMVDNAQVIKADVETSNGVIHVINNVVLPKS